MDLDLKSKTAVVTGASIGIGRAIAKALAIEGVRVVAVARRNDLLEKLAREVLAEGGAPVIPVVQDITREDAASKLAAAARRRSGSRRPYWSTTPVAADLCRWTLLTAIGMKRLP
jgi:3-oxoacyl-[acyl-carrier protein] reductase